MSTALQPSPIPRMRRGGVVGIVLGWVGIGLLVLATPLVVFFLATSVQNPTAIIMSSVLALIPLAFVVWAALAIDRWEPEPALALVFAAMWGGIGAIIGTVIVNEFILQPVWTMFISTDAEFEFIATVLQAPFTEELMKAVPILVMFFFFRRHFDGPIDGIVLAALSGAGFAYTENILYFGRTLIEVGDASFTFFQRGIMSPLAHAIFTAIGIGLAMGLAARLSNRLWGLLVFPIGWGVSAILHSFWNSAGWWVPGGIGGFFIYFLVVQVPICFAALLLVLLLRRQESRITQVRLKEYARAGWFSDEEATRLSTSDGRAGLLQWARRRNLKRAMNRYIQMATRLAANRQRAVVGREKLRPVADEAHLLADVASIRRHMATAAAGAPVSVQAGRMLPSPVAGVVPDAQRFAGHVPMGQAQPRMDSSPGTWQRQGYGAQQQRVMQQPHGQHPHAPRPPAPQPTSAPHGQPQQGQPQFGPPQQEQPPQGQPPQGQPPQGQPPQGQQPRQWPPVPPQR